MKFQGRLFFFFPKSSIEILPLEFAGQTSIVIIRKRNGMYNIQKSKGGKVGEGILYKVYQSELIEIEEGKGMIKRKHECNYRNKFKYIIK